MSEHEVTVEDEIADIKKFVFDKENNQIALLSESSEDFLPIFVHPEDSGHISETVVQVVQNPTYK